MATTKTITFDSFNYVGKDGRHIVLTVKDTITDASNNESRIDWTLTTEGGAVTYYDTFCMVKINGVTVISPQGFSQNVAAGYSGWVWANDHPYDQGIWINPNGSDYTYAKWGYTASGSIEHVKHGQNGKKKISVQFLVGIFYYVVQDCGGSFELTDIPVDTAKPVVNQGTPSLVMSSPYFGLYAITISAYSSGISNWWYRFRISGSSKWSGWILSAGNATSCSTTITALSPNTSYDFQWTAEKRSNRLVGLSGVASAQTLAVSELLRVTPIRVTSYTSASAQCTIRRYSTTAYTHQLTLSHAGSAGTITPTLNSGDSFTLNSQQINTLLGWLPENSSQINNITATLTTKYGSSVVGTSTYVTSASVSQQLLIPEISEITYTDTNQSSISITRDPSLILAAGVLPDNPNLCSILKLTNIEITARRGASIQRIDFIFNGQTQTVGTSADIANILNSKSYVWGEVGEVASSEVTVTVTDSRNYVASRKVLLHMYSRGVLIREEDYNRWYQSLFSHWTAASANNDYYLYYTMPVDLAYHEYNAANFLAERREGDEVKATDFCDLGRKHMAYWTEALVSLDGSQVAPALYNAYVSKSAAIYAIHAQAEEVLQAKDELIEADVKSVLDANFDILDGIVAFNFQEPG